MSIKQCIPRFNAYMGASFVADAPWYRRETRLFFSLSSADNVPFGGTLRTKGYSNYYYNPS